MTNPPSKRRCHWLPSLCGRNSKIVHPSYLVSVSEKPNMDELARLLGMCKAIRKSLQEPSTPATMRQTTSQVGDRSHARHCCNEIQVTDANRRQYCYKASVTQGVNKLTP